MNRDLQFREYDFRQILSSRQIPSSQKNSPQKIKQNDIQSLIHCLFWLLKVIPESNIYFPIFHRIDQRRHSKPYLLAILTAQFNTKSNINYQIFHEFIMS